MNVNLAIMTDLSKIIGNVEEEDIYKKYLALQEFNECLWHITLAEYLEWLVSMGTTTLVTDLDHWEQIGILTATDLGDYLDACVKEG